MRSSSQQFRDPRLADIAGKLASSERLNRNDGLVLLETTDLINLGRMADAQRRRRHGDKAYFVYNQHLNYTNVCQNRCQFCAFARDDGQQGAYTMTLAEVEAQLRRRIDEPIREVHMVGGIHPDLPFDYYVDLLETIKRVRPEATIKAFTAVEIDHIARRGGLTVEETLQRLKAAGLEMMPGGGAEVLSERIHDRLYHRKIDGNRWLEVVRAAHRIGLVTNATMLYGHIETPAERIDHLLALRALQDETGGFSAFIPLAFHPKNTRLNHIADTTAFDDLKTIAAARLLLDNIDHIKAYWVMIGEPLAQVALNFGADDLDGTIIEEKITHMAGATSAKGLGRAQLKRMISAAGFVPVERDAFYHPAEAL
jgi:aminodeoxyfutalosine synthase